HPELTGRIERIVLMGGSIAEGNVTPAAEFNIWADPEAASRVFTSGLDVTMVGLDVTHKALFTPDHAERVRGASRAGKLAPEPFSSLSGGCACSVPPMSDPGCCCRLLLVDDDDRFLGALTALLDQDGRFEVLGRAHNGAEAVGLSASLSPDVVLMDIDMPVMD